MKNAFDVIVLYVYVGIKTTTQGATLRQLRKSIPGFLELFSERKFDRLAARSYQSLLKFEAYPDTVAGSKKTYYAVLLCGKHTTIISANSFIMWTGLVIF